MKYFSVFILLFITWTSNAQKAKIQGVVKNAGTKSPIELATITLKNLNDTSKLLGAKTGADGTFSINDIPYGKYKIQ
ncbi:MAG TPA: carboxypeptidase regulatory-like domain-containing protein, partial [Chitinophagaceae bacterium]|nr:carboxypeptidase regulatory-like domain-containing protein [Chitinophagaceae bacterium]